MPPAQSRCAGCDSRLRDLQYPVPLQPGRYRCRTCANDVALWQYCSLAWCRTAQPARCRPLVELDGREPSAARLAAMGKYACPACVNAHECTLLSVLPDKLYPLEGSSSAAALMSAVHLQFVHVEVHVWVLPMQNRCLYYWARVILWRIFGVFLGVLQGPNKSKSNRAASRAAIGKHIHKLKQQGRWPRTEVPVVVIGVDDHKLPAKIKGFTKAQRQRLKGFRPSLTRGNALHGATRSLDWTALNLDPAAAAHANVPLVKTCAKMLESIGVTTNGRPGNGQRRLWNADTPEERAFRRSLHTSMAVLFR